MRSICCVFNVAPHYNESIYKLIDKELNCEFYIGDRMPYSIELMNYDELKGFKSKLKNVYLVNNFYWQRGILKCIFNGYKHYIVTGEPYCLSTWLLLISNRICGRKTYLWTHGWYGNEGIVKTIVKKLFFKLSNKILLYGDYAKKLMIAQGFKEENLIPVYNSLNYDEQVKIRGEITTSNIYVDYFNNKNPVVLYVGRIQKRKKIELLIEAIKELNSNQIDCNLILIGKIIDQTNLAQIIEKYELQDKIWQYGSCYNESELAELIYNASLCVVPGDIGLTSIHSMVFGTPVVTHDNFPSHGPEFEVVKSGITGDFFKENSLSDLCEKISCWIQVDLERRELIRNDCYREVDEKYNPNKQIEIIKNLI